MPKVTALTADIAPTLDDLILSVNDPAGTPASRKVSLGDLALLFGLLQENAQTGTTYTLVLSDRNKLVSMSNSSANTLTVPPNSSVPFPIGSRIPLRQGGVGITTVAAGTGVAVLALNNTLALSGQHAGAWLIKIGTDTWWLALIGGSSSGGGGGSSGRERLTANRTYHQSNNGSDANNGLTSATSFLTLQYAIDLISSTLDLNGFTVTISSIAFGILPAPLVLKDCVGEGQVVIQNASNSSNALDKPTTIVAGQGFIEAINLSTSYQLLNVGFRQDSLVAGVHALKIENASLLWHLTQENECIQGAFDTAIYVGFRGSLIRTSTSNSTSTPNYVRGSHACHLLVERGGYVRYTGQVSIGEKGNATYSDAFWKVNNGYLDTIGISYGTVVGTWSGIEHKVTLNGVYTKTVTAPGLTAGTTATGGQVA